MKKFFLSLVSLTVLLSSCGYDVVKFNDTIIEGVDGAIEKLGKIDDFIYNDEYTDAVSGLDSLQLYVTDYLGKVSALDYKSGESFKAKALDILNLIDGEFIPAYKNAIKEYQVADNMDDDDAMQAKYDEIYNRLNVLYEKMEVMETDILEIQKEFAKENDMDLY